MYSRPEGELLGNRYSVCLLIGSLLIAVSTVKSRSPCKNATENVVFLDFVPCALNGSSVSMLTVREILEKCDLLVQAAVQLAVERINQRPDILANKILHVHDVSVQLLDFGKVSIQFGPYSMYSGQIIIRIHRI